MRTHPIERYQTLRDSAPCLSRAATSRRTPNWKSEVARAWEHHPRKPYRRRVSTDQLNQEDSQLSASLEGKTGPHPPERPSHARTPKPGFGGRGHEVYCIYILVYVINPACNNPDACLYHLAFITSNANTVRMYLTSTCSAHVYVQASRLGPDHMYVVAIS